MVRVIFPSRSNFIAPLLAIRELHDEIQVKISSNDVTATILDRTHVSISYITWTCTTEGPVPAGGLVLCLKIPNLVKAVTLGCTGDHMAWVHDGSSDKMTVELGDGEVSVELNLFDFDADAMERPEFTPGVTLDVPGSRLAVTVRDLSSVGDTASIKATVDPVAKAASFTMTTAGEIGTARITTDAELLQFATEEFPDEAQMFALRYLVTILKAATKPQQTVNLSLTKGMPLVVSISNESMHLSYFLAPKFDEDM
jgi:hypothetical protein